MVQDHWTLLHLIRAELGYSGTKEGCGSGECGACTVMVDGVAVNACLYLAAEIDGRNLVTIEGLAAPDGTLHPIQKAFVENGAIQCGFCSPGMIMSAKALLDENRSPAQDEICAAIAGNLCRCTGYVQIIESIQKVSTDSDADGEIVAWRDETRE